MAVYDPDPTLLADQIESIKRQTVTNWICFVAIDGCDPVAVRNLKNLIADDTRFRIKEFPDRVGFYRNFERVIGLVDPSMQWIALSDQDDFWYPNKLEMLLGHLASKSMVVGQARLVWKSSQLGKAQKLRTTNRTFEGIGGLMFDNVVTGALSVFRADLLQYALPFPPKTDVAYHDHWLGLCAASDLGLETVPDVVQDYIQHEHNVIGEELGASISSRMADLIRRSRGMTNSLRYLVNHRWRWRVNMARIVLCRMPHIEDDKAEVLRAFAKDKANLRLFRTLVPLVTRARGSKLRVLAIFGAAIAAPFIEEEITVEA